jgi:hypothetical protein
MKSVKRVDTEFYQKYFLDTRLKTEGDLNGNGIILQFNVFLAV